MEPYSDVQKVRYLPTIPTNLHQSIIFLKVWWTRKKQKKLEKASLLRLLLGHAVSLCR